MGMDYYKLLGVDKGANAEQLKVAYKKQAIKWHPDKNMNQLKAAEERFKAIAEAYDVLSDPQKRAIYDRYGEEGLKGRAPAPGSTTFTTSQDGPSFTYSGVDPDMARRLFESMFGSAPGGACGSMHHRGTWSQAAGRGSTTFQFMSSGPGGRSGPGGATFQFMSSGPGGRSGPGGATFQFMRPGPGGRSGPVPTQTGGHRRRWASAFGGNGGEEETFTAGTASADPFAAFGMNTPADSFFQQQQPGGSGGNSSTAFKDQSQAAPQVVALPLTLEELYTGCTKRLKVTRHVMDAASGKSFPVSEVLEVQVKPGWKEGTRVTFAGKGDERAPGTATDLVFVVKQKPHPRFDRQNNNLHTHIKLPLVTALTGGTASVTMPDGHIVQVPITGVPVQPGASKMLVGEGMPISKGGKGDLHVTFDVVFPAHLTSQQRSQLQQVLPAV